MATSSLLSFLFVVAFLAAGAYARPGVHFHPCKTLFISYTFSTSGTLDLPQIKAPHDLSSDGGYFTVYRIFRPLPIIVDRPRLEAVNDLIQSEPSFGMSSLRERAKDILVVVAGLLFGVGCGALTGGIMYLVWSLFTNQYEICRFHYEEDEEEEEESPKKMGYVQVPDTVSAKEGVGVTSLEPARIKTDYELGPTDLMIIEYANPDLQKMVQPAHNSVAAHTSEGQMAHIQQSGSFTQQLPYPATEEEEEGDKDLCGNRGEESWP